MKTTCYCVGCEKHPLYGKQYRQKTWISGYLPDDNLINDVQYEEYGYKVNCLNPVSEFFDETGADPKDYEFPKTVYYENAAKTYFNSGKRIEYATCENVIEPD